ncbi:hypothetical protein C8R44DRAFT_878715 [Mycena epipterygia]|nr:hypothetical protein C8R44DRAFT_878715 [Mycena epipterygia]
MTRLRSSPLSTPTVAGDVPSDSPRGSQKMNLQRTIFISHRPPANDKDGSALGSRAHCWHAPSSHTAQDLRSNFAPVRSTISLAAYNGIQTHLTVFSMPYLRIVVCGHVRVDGARGTGARSPYRFWSAVQLTRARAPSGKNDYHTPIAFS